MKQSARRASGGLLPADPRARAQVNKWLLFTATELEQPFLVGNDVTVADFVAAYTLDWANEVRLLDASPQLRGFLERMYARPHAPPRIAEALASVRG